jgi:mono/diheme cytochrome c family protein
MSKTFFKTAAFLAAAAALVACGEQQVSLDGGDQAKSSPVRAGAEIFADKCAGCHTLDVAGTQGSAVNVRNRERTDGPNFNTRREDKNSVLYAIRNGGFSGAIMPENIVVGHDAELVADFLAKYAGRDIKKTTSPTPANEQQSTSNSGDVNGAPTTTSPGQSAGGSDPGVGD